MLTARQYLARYGHSHRHPTNQMIHLVCVPIIVLATLGLLWSVKLGWSLPVIGPVNLAIVLAAPVLFFYARLGWRSLIIALTLGAACRSAVAQESRYRLPERFDGQALEDPTDER